MDIKDQIKQIKKTRTSFCELILSDIFNKIKNNYIEYYNDSDFIDFYIKNNNILFRYYTSDNTLVISNQIYNFINNNDNIILEKFYFQIKKYFDKIIEKNNYVIKLDNIFPLDYDFFDIE